MKDNQTDNSILSLYNVENDQKISTMAVDNFLKVRTGAKDVVMPGDTINQTLKLTNQTGEDITNISIKDTIGEGATFKSRSVVIDGTSYADYNPVTGFSLPEKIKSSNSNTITYSVVIDDAPTTRTFPVVSAITFTLDGVEYTENSSTFTMELAYPEVSLTKTSNKSATVQGDTLTYQNVISNTGNLKATKITFSDALSDKVSFVEKSVKVDGVANETANPIDGFRVKDLYAKEKMTVTFDVTVK